MQQFGHQRLTWSRGEDGLGVLDQECVFICVVVLVTAGDLHVIVELLCGDLLELLLHYILLGDLLELLLHCII